MSIKKKIGLAVVAILIAILVGSYISVQKDKGTSGDKEITIKIVDETVNKTVYDEVLHTDTLTLEALLKEQTQLKAVIETSTYGGLLTSLMNLEQDMSKGPWWLFTSENNKICVEQTMCPAIDQVTIANQDIFTFTYTSDLGF